MAVDMKALRNRLKQETQKTTNNQNDGAVYQFWNLEPGTTSQIRLLPDGNKDNDAFWVERQMINLEFDGVVGRPEYNGKTVKVQVPSMETWNEECPILAEARKFYKDGRDELGKKYWKKRSYVFQGLVRQSGFVEENPPANPVRRLLINPSLYKIIFAYLLDEDNDDLDPTDYENGADFRITRTQKGEYADYSTSSFARKNSALTEAELAAIEQHGLFNLSEFLPNKPNAETLVKIQEMFEASVDGAAYDPARFGNFYKPYGLEIDSSNAAQAPAASTTRPAAPAVNESDDIPFAPDAPNEVKSAAKTTPQELLARLKNSKNG